MISEDGKVHDAQRLKELQALPLERKVGITAARIIEWYRHFNGNVCISFSGGKDSTVLLTIARQLYPDIPAVYCDTGLEYPEVKAFVKTFDNITILKPRMPFHEVVRTTGYPVISKEVAEVIQECKKAPDGGKNSAKRRRQLDGELMMADGVTPSHFNCAKYKPLLDVDFEISNLCCRIMKKEPMNKYIKETGRAGMTAMMADESRRRQTSWIRFGCNGFDMKHPRSMPMAFWTENDVLAYIHDMDIKIASVYGDVEEVDGQLAIPGFNCPYRTTGCNRTGCMFCAFGAHMEKGVTRFQRLKETHPKQYKYCINGGAYDIDGKWKPDKNGLGLRHVFDTLNDLYGVDFIRYE